MLSILSTVMAAILPQGPGSSTAPVVINEFQYDDSGTDDFEFVELYNRSGGPVDISGWSVVNRDPGSAAYGGSGVDPTHVIPGLPGSGTVILPAGGFYLFANVAVVPVGAPVAVQVIAANSLENGASGTGPPSESVELLDGAGAVVDSLAYEIGGGGVFGLAPYGPHPLEGNGFYGDLSVNNGIGLPAAAHGRYLDGWDNDDNGRDFGLCNAPTPGGTNLVASALPYSNNFNIGAPGGTIPGWTYGWVAPILVDPASMTGTAASRPPSPDGGLAMATWDSAGGGNSVQLYTTPVADVVVDTYVYLEPVMSPFNPALYSPAVPPVLLDNYNYADGEWWALGVRGTSQGNGNPPNVGGYFTAIAPGVGTRYHTVTGIAWAHFRTTSVSDLYLIDFGNGPDPATGTNFSILAGPINIVAGVNDGWQRLRLHAQGNKVVANFGGTPGCADGTTYTATGVYESPGSVYVSYREAILYNSNGLAGCHPPLFDRLDIHLPTTTQSFVGTGSPTSVGIPVIDSNGYASIGNLTFAIRGSNMKPFGSPGYAFCGVVIGFGLFPPGFPIPSAPPTALGHVLPIGGSSVGFADAGGNVTFPLGIPCVPAFLGTPLCSQIVDFDATLPFAAPIGVSRGMQTDVGN